MRIMKMSLLVVGILALVLTAAFAAGKGCGQGKGQCRAKSNCPLTQAAAVTLSGAVRELVQPEAGKQAGPVQFTLAADKGNTLVHLGPPQAMKALNLAPANGDAVTVTGWQITREKVTWVVARTVIVKDTTYTLRAEDGKPVWCGQGGCGSGCGNNGGAGCGQGKGACKRQCAQ